MSVSSLPGTSGLAASKSATASSTPHSRRGLCNSPRSDTGIEKSAHRLREAPALGFQWRRCSLTRRCEAVRTFVTLLDPEPVVPGRLPRFLAPIPSVSYKSESPVAAALAINYLIRSGDLDYLLDWPRNLANWFEWLPDGPILWAETLLRRQEIQKSAAAPDASADIRDDRARLYQLRHHDLARQILFGGHDAHVADNGSRLPVNGAIYQRSRSRALSGGNHARRRKTIRDRQPYGHDKRKFGSGSRIHNGIVGRARSHGGAAPDRARP